MQPAEHIVQEPPDYSVGKIILKNIYLFRNGYQKEKKNNLYQQWSRSKIKPGQQDGQIYSALSCSMQISLTELKNNKKKKTFGVMHTLRGEKQYKCKKQEGKLTYKHFVARESNTAINIGH